MQWSAWDVGRTASKPRPAVPCGRPGKRRQRGEDGFYMTSVATSTRPPPERPQAVSRCARHGTRGGRRAEDTAMGRRQLERSLALYQRRLQQVMGLTRAEAHIERCRRRLKVVKLLPCAGRTSGAAEGGYEGEDADESAEVPSSVRWRLTFTTPQEECRLARAWRDLESQATAILPKTVRARALALLGG